MLRLGPSPTTRHPTAEVCVCYLWHRLRRRFPNTYRRCVKEQASETQNLSEKRGDGGIGSTGGQRAFLRASPAAKPRRVAFCGIQIQNSTYGHIRARMKDWIAAARQVVGQDRLMTASFDRHGSLGLRTIDTLDMLSAFRTAPHIDREETAKRACDMLVHCLDQQIRPTMIWSPIPVLMPGARSSTLYEPASVSGRNCPPRTRRPSAERVAAGRLRLSG